MRLPWRRPAPTADLRILAAMQAGGIADNRTNAVAAFGKVGGDPGRGFTLAACCSMLVAESNGRNIWGGDPWNPGEYPKGAALPSSLHEQPVTFQNYQPYKQRRNQGMQPQGCGPCQLTDASLQVEAERNGGCWMPQANMIVGFHFLKQLFQREGSALAGFGAYNGSGPQGAYAQAAVARMNHFQALFDGH